MIVNVTNDYFLLFLLALLNINIHINLEVYMFKTRTKYSILQYDSQHMISISKYGVTCLYVSKYIINLPTSMPSAITYIVLY